MSDADVMLSVGETVAGAVVGPVMPGSLVGVICRPPSVEVGLSVDGS